MQNVLELRAPPPCTNWQAQPRGRVSEGGGRTLCPKSIVKFSPGGWLVRYDVPSEIKGDARNTRGEGSFN